MNFPYLANIETTINNIETDLSTAESDILANKASINTLTSDKADKTTVTALDTRVTTAESDITAIKTNLGTINLFMNTDPETRIATLEGKVTANEG